MDAKNMIFLSFISNGRLYVLMKDTMLKDFFEISGGLFKKKKLYELHKINTFSDLIEFPRKFTKAVMW